MTDYTTCQKLAKIEGFEKELIAASREFQG
jgi:hypothetical protein